MKKIGEACASYYELPIKHVFMFHYVTEKKLPEFLTGSFLIN
ncbi:hypothetical protein ACQCT6_16505 [Cytobacillus gottheilii]|nr:hypothetical protein [Cytobacillus gottheilii]